MGIRNTGCPCWMFSPTTFIQAPQYNGSNNEYLESHFTIDNPNSYHEYVIKRKDNVINVYIYQELKAQSNSSAMHDFHTSNIGLFFLYDIRDHYYYFPTYAKIKSFTWYKGGNTLPMIYNNIEIN